MATPPPDQPRLEAWVDTGGEDDQLHVRVTQDGTEFESVDSDLGALLGNEQYLNLLSRCALTLMTLYDRNLADDAGTDRPPEPGAEVADDAA